MARRVHVILLTSIVLLPVASTRLASAQATSARAARTGAALYRNACASCHGPDGKGMPQSVVGFATALPDFTDCGFTTPEPDVDWLATIHRGGPARGFDRMMPAFGDALSDEEIDRTLAHVRTFCTDRAWPRGELNLPRPLVTGKAFPENEAILTTTIATAYPRSIENLLVFEHRLGARNEYEIVVPFNLQQGVAGAWTRGLGDVQIGFKRVLAHGSSFILSGGSDMTFPTGDFRAGLGQRLVVYEPFVAFGQQLAAGATVQVHAGLEFPLNSESADNEFFWRATLGKTFTPVRWGRAWTPMFEWLARRELAHGEPVFWDGLPQLQVTLSRRQHVRLNGGVRMPLTRHLGRDRAVLIYALWDWADGGLFSGW